MILLAPNGKPSNLTPEQYKLVRTPAFKEWFGDWENSPENSSKVVDSNGEPLVVYHGTKENWWNDYFVFNPQYEGKSTNIKRRKFGSTYFTSKKKVAQTFGNILIPVFLNFENPIVIDADYHDIMWVDNELETTNYEDDIIIKNTYDYRASNVELDADMSSDIFLVTQLFNKIKLADGTNTTFDSNNPDIRFDGGGSIEQNRDESLKKIGNFWNWLDENHWKEIVNQEDIEKLNLESTDSYGFNTGIYYESPNGEILFVFSQRSRIIKDKYGIVNQISLRYDKEPVLVLTYLVVKNKGIGIGSKAIKLLTELCDKFGITIQLQPKPIKTIGEFLSTEQLVKFYEKAGFKITYDGGGSDKIMEYKPNDIRFMAGGKVDVVDIKQYNIGKRNYRFVEIAEKKYNKIELYRQADDGNYYGQLLYRGVPRYNAEFSSPMVNDMNQLYAYEPVSNEELFNAVKNKTKPFASFGYWLSYYTEEEIQKEIQSFIDECDKYDLEYAVEKISGENKSLERIQFQVCQKGTFDELFDINALIEDYANNDFDSYDIEKLEEFRYVELSYFLNNEWDEHYALTGLILGIPPKFTMALINMWTSYGLRKKYQHTENIVVIKNNNTDALFKKGGQVNYTELIEGYKISLELEKDSKKKKLYQDIIDGYQIASELNQPKKTKSKVILLAPNGKPSNLNPEQYKLVRTTAFKQWFGDWENDPKNSSQVIDENGEPLLVYRGDNAESKKGYTFKTGYNRLAFINKKRLPNDYFHYFVDKYDIALQYAENQVSEHNGKVSWTGKGKRWEAKVTPYFLNIRKPIDITPNNPLFPTYNQFKKEIKPKGGYMKEWYLSWYIPFWYGFFISYKYLDKIFKEKLGENYLYNDKSPESMNQEIIEYFYKERPNYRLIYEFFIEWKDEYTQSAWLGRLHTSMILNKVDGMVFLEDTHWYIETTKAENEKYEKGLLQLDPEIWKEKPKVFATLDSEQIKLADGSNTTFDGDNPDIRFDDGGRTL